MTAIINEADASGDYRWTVGDKRFSLGLFRGSPELDIRF
jgi:hypothetical protein